MLPMSVYDLNREQLVQLKQSYLCDTKDTVFMSELAFADEIVSDNVIFENYAGYIFSSDDFC